jgi:hypothetical protein
MAYAPQRAIQSCVARDRCKGRIRRFTYWDQLLALAFEQLTHRESLSDIEVSLGAMRNRLYHMGLRCGAVTSQYTR